MMMSERSPGVISSVPSDRWSIRRGTLMAATLMFGTGRERSSSEPRSRVARTAPATSRIVGCVRESSSGSIQTGTEHPATALPMADQSACGTRLTNAPTVGTPRSPSPSMAAVRAPLTWAGAWSAAVSTIRATAPRFEAISAFRANSKALEAPR